MFNLVPSTVFHALREFVRPLVRFTNNLLTNNYLIFKAGDRRLEMKIKY